MDLKRAMFLLLLLVGVAAADAPETGVHWFKRGKNYRLDQDRQEIKGLVWVYVTQGNPVVYHPASKTFYELTGFENLSDNQYHKGKKLDFKTGEQGFWYVSERDGSSRVSSFKNDGSLHQWKDKKSFYTGLGGRVLMTQDGSGVVMENYLDSAKEKYTIHPLGAYDEVRHGKAFRVETSGSREPVFTWKKTQAGDSYWLLKDSKEVPRGTVWLYKVHGNALIYDPRTLEFFELTGYESLPAEQLHSAKLLSAKIGELGFWTSFYKDGEVQYFYLKRDGTTYRIVDKKESRYDRQGNLVFTFKDGRTIVMENFKLGKHYTIYPIVAYDPAKHR